MKPTGAVLMLIGLGMVLFAFMMNTTVTTAGSYIAGTYVEGSSTYNLGLLQQQMMVFQSGLAAFVAGSILYGAGARDGERAGQRFVDTAEVGHSDGGAKHEPPVQGLGRHDLLVVGIALAVIIVGSFVAITVENATKSSSSNAERNISTTNGDDQLNAVADQAARDAENAQAH